VCETCPALSPTTLDDGPMLLQLSAFSTKAGQCAKSGPSLIEGNSRGMEQQQPGRETHGPFHESPRSNMYTPSCATTLKGWEP
jgi:hypothetical protein